MPKEETKKVVEQKKNPVRAYVDRLAAADENVWKDHLESMGNGPDIPKLFRSPGKVRMGSYITIVCHTLFQPMFRMSAECAQALGRIECI
jgi:hypothetical protein